ncbi:MAG: Crp/Fnr family transcriptional regulator [Elusimicrobia bacterium]|nr:Crp/Fnr family transcriptional regulator [Elusimicrobiota bacterium]
MAAAEGIDESDGAWLWIVRQGVLGVFAHSPEGGTCAAEILEPGDMFGGCLCACRSSLGRAHCEVRALIPSDLVGVPDEAVRGCLAEHPGVTEAILAAQAGRLLRAVEMSASRSDSPKGRLLHFILRLDSLVGPVIPLKRRELAAALGLSTETIIRAMSPYVRRGLLNSRRGGVTVVDRQALRRAAAAL